MALSAGAQVLATEDLARGIASAEIVSAVRRMLEQLEWRLADLDAVGVVHGPGSFTGMRAGLATAKGLCEASGLPLAAVSRLEVLADVAGLDGISLREGLVALDAGRGELYVRDVLTGREWLCASDAFVVVAEGRQVIVAEARVAEQLSACQPVLRSLRVGDALGTVLRKLRAGGSDVSLTDANYVREESDIYGKSARTAGSAGART